MLNNKNAVRFGEVKNLPGISKAIAACPVCGKTHPSLLATSGTAIESSPRG